jgi:hypothetical protein
MAGFIGCVALAALPFNQNRVKMKPAPSREMISPHPMLTSPNHNWTLS